VPESVHLCDYPTADAVVVDDPLSDQMRLLREIASLGRAARMEAKLKVRQPLAKVEVILAGAEHQNWLEAHEALLRDELNVKQVEYTREADRYIAYQIQPNFKRLGPRIGPLLPKVKQALGKADGAALLAQLKTSGKVMLRVEGQTVELDGDDIQVRLQAKSGWAAAQGAQCVVVLSTELTPALVREGLARDVVRLVQERRKELDCKYTDRLRLGVVTDDLELQAAIQENAEFIQGETLAVELSLAALPGADSVEHDVGGSLLAIYVIVVPDQP
jgi:isoleucyl-tRNA synthetase